MRKWVITLLVGLTSAGLVASCTPPLPPDAQAVAAERILNCVAGEQQITTPDYLTAPLEFVNDTLMAQCPEQSMAFVSDGDLPVQILDRAPTDAEIADFERFCGSEVVVAPIFGFASDIAYNQPGLDDVFLTADVAADILTGKITQWNDPRITDLNEGYEFDSTPIVLLRLGQPSGAVEAFTKWLSEAAPENWSLGQLDVLPNGKEIDGMQSLLDELSLEYGALTVVPTYEAQIFAMQLASLPAGESQINAVDSDFPKIGMAAAEINFDDKGHMRTTHATGGVPIEGQFDAAAAKIVIQPGQEIVGWPSNAVAHVMACDKPDDPLPKATAQFLVRLSAQGSIEGAGLTGLPEPIRFRTFPALKVELPEDLTSIDLEIEEEVVENETGLEGQQ